MVRLRHTAFFPLITAAALCAGTIQVIDSTFVQAAIVDTGGGSVTVRHGGRDVRIGKKQVLKVAVGADSLFLKPGRHRVSGAAAILDVNDAIVSILAAYPVQKTAIALNAGIAFQKQPLVSTGGVDRKSIEAFNDRMARFLTGQGPHCTLSMAGAFFYLSDSTQRGGNFRYLAMPALMSVRAIERKMSVSSFARLDTAGNFVPAKTGTTLSARETETTVRFVVIDLRAKTIVFDARLKERDQGLQSLAPANSAETQSASVKNSILSIERKIETLLKKSFH